MSASDVAVSVRGLSKSYTIVHDEGERHVTLAETALARLRNPFRRPRTETFHALRDVDFDIRRGDVVGIIGRNGAGKSTLLKILSRITEPTAGRIDLYGRVGSLLEVGTGFHPELTGRENVFLNGAILGMTKAEIRRQFDAIVDFAGVEQFLDTPVKRYSSGMYVRLAFAVAAHLRNEILLLDEVLAVGDATFQKKCLGKVGQVARDGRTILLVSHNIGVMKSTCTTAIQLQAGRVVCRGDIQAVARSYEGKAAADRKGTWTNGAAAGGEATIVAVELRDARGRPATEFRSSEPCDVSFTIRVDQPTDLLKFGFDLIKNDAIVFRAQQVDSPRPLDPFPPGTHQVTCRIPADLLFAGTYEIEPQMSLHHVKWLVPPRGGRLTFDVEFDPADSPFLNLLNNDNHPALLFPRLLWTVG